MRIAGEVDPSLVIKKSFLLVNKKGTNMNEVIAFYILGGATPVLAVAFLLDVLARRK